MPGDQYSCQLFELVNSSPFPLPLLSTQVFIISTAVKTILITNGKVESYIHKTLSEAQA